MDEIDTSASFYNDKHKNNSFTPITWNEGRLTSLQRYARHAARERHSPVNTLEPPFSEGVGRCLR